MTQSHETNIESKDISSDDNVFVVGRNSSAELCLGHFKRVRKLINWQKYNENLKVKHVNNAYFFTIITDNQQKYYITGFNQFGECGMGRFNQMIIKLGKIPFSMIEILKLIKYSLHHMLN